MFQEAEAQSPNLPWKQGKHKSGTIKLIVAELRLQLTFYLFTASLLFWEKSQVGTCLVLWQPGQETLVVLGTQGSI